MGLRFHYSWTRYKTGVLISNRYIVTAAENTDFPEPSGGGGGDEETNPVYWLALPGALGISDYADHYYRHPELWNHQISRIDVHPAYKGRPAAKKYYNKLFLDAENLYQSPCTSIQLCQL